MAIFWMEDCETIHKEWKKRTREGVMSTIQLQGELNQTFAKVHTTGEGGWTGHITMQGGAQLQAPLPPRYLQLTPDEIVVGIARAKERLGSKLVILGHHYQR